jgi:hypothetical protein
MMGDSPFIARLLYRVFLLSWIFAVLWVKEYLWWTFTIAALLLLLTEVVLPMVALSKAIDSGSNPIPSSSGVDQGDPDIWREPKPPRSSSRSKKS